MFGRKTEGKPPSKIDSLIGAGTMIEGNIRFAGGLRVDGEIKGNVEATESGSASVLVISEKAQIEGAVNVDHMIISGTVVGPVKVQTSIEMHPKARIIGDVEYDTIEMHQGAIIEGHLVHRPSRAAEPTESPADQTV
ncbi:polymer-forming cytoskeletal protein [Dechloromonas sp. ZY10]|uniref:bactofilin family protein n=1 Tax=Dechloromonas aquae TaxID=2664436 RepID=UPI003527DE52